jgi:3-dehydroquinate synthase
MTRHEVHVAVPTPARDHRVVVAAGVLAELPSAVGSAAPSARIVAIVSDANVWAHHGARAQALLAAEGLAVATHIVAPGEASKSADVLVATVDALLAAGLTRTDAVVALGGGVVGDLAGLAAHLCLRGLPIVQCPTSLLAQVDASIGGKVAIDRPAGKNLLGAFQFPAAVLVDPELLATLPEREISCGVAEMIKHGLLFSAHHLAAIDQHAPQLHARDPAVLTELVAASVALKAACVATDPFETGAGGRALLNLGHTLGHAIEHVSGFALHHGEAVALGLVAAARVSERLALTDAALEDEVVLALARHRLPVDLDAWTGGAHDEALVAALARDKKRGGDTITYIALHDIAQPCPVQLSPAEILAAARPRT